jgi:hypothetical protein
MPIVQDSPTIVYTDEPRAPRLAPLVMTEAELPRLTPRIARRHWLSAYVDFLLRWSPLLLCAYIARESGSELVALVVALFGVGYIFWMRWED